MNRPKEIVKELKALSDNWDSYGAKSFDPDFCDILECILEELEDIGIKYAVDPGGDGNIFIELIPKTSARTDSTVYSKP